MTPSASLLLGEVTEMSQLREVRLVLAAELERLGLAEERIADALVMATELAANSLEHAHQLAAVSLTWTHDEVVVSCFDSGEEPPVPQPNDASRAGGRGLMLVDAFADRHGIDTAADGGKAVWFALDRR